MNTIKLTKQEFECMRNSIEDLMDYADSYVYFCKFCGMKAVPNNFSPSWKKISKFDPIQHTKACAGKRMLKFLNETQD
jgi:hypothetical protein